MAPPSLQSSSSYGQVIEYIQGSWSLPISIYLSSTDHVQTDCTLLRTHILPTRTRRSHILPRRSDRLIKDHPEHNQDLHPAQ